MMGNFVDGILIFDIFFRIIMGKGTEDEYFSVLCIVVIIICLIIKKIKHW